MKPIQCVAFSPPVPVREMLGKNEALATPICALAATMISSACRTSGEVRAILKADLRERPRTGCSVRRLTAGNGTGIFRQAKC